MKSVLISIQPKWCELIASGEKTVEVRKTKPKLNVPFKVYIYCTKGRGDCLWRWNGIWYDTQDPNHRPNRLDGYVIGEFVCDEITPLFNVATTSWNLLAGNVHEYAKALVRMACLTEEEMHSYAKGKYCYAWHISDLVIYDEPRLLYEFYRRCEKLACEPCMHFKYVQLNSSERGYDCEYLNGCIPLMRPPQSWCYVEGS